MILVVARPQPSPRAQACPVPARHCDARVSTLQADAHGLCPQRLLSLGGRQPAETLAANPAGPGAGGGRAARGPEAGFHSVLSDMCHATLGVSATDALRSHELAACAADLALGAGAGGAAPAPGPAAGAAGPAPGAGAGGAAAGRADPAAGAAGPGPPCPDRACKLRLAVSLMSEAASGASNTLEARNTGCRHARRPAPPQLEFLCWQSSTNPKRCKEQRRL